MSTDDDTVSGSTSEGVKAIRARHAARGNMVVALYLCGELPLQEAAEELVYMMFHPEEWVELGWDLLLKYAVKDVGTHAKLTVLLARIPSITPDWLANFYKDDGELESWSSFPKFGWALNHEWNSLDVPEESGPKRHQVVTRFINVNKFVALITCSDLPALQNKNMFCIWTMRYALEYEATARNPSDVFLPAAAAWINIAGSHLYEWDDQFPHGRNHGDPGGGGPLLSGEHHGFNRERWDFWRRRFGELAEEAGIELMEVAKDAELKMMEIERAAANEMP